MEIRRDRPDQYSLLGEITVRAYRSLIDDGSLGTYEAELRDVARRDTDSEVYVAIGNDGSVLGGVTIRDPVYG
jgi:hypothetical protein